MGSQEGFEHDYLCGVDARFSAQVCTIGHTRTGSCICTKSDRFPYFDVNPPACPVSGHSRLVWSVALSPDGNRVVSGSEDNLVKIWDTETGAEVSSVVGLRRVWRGDRGVGSSRSLQIVPWQSSEMRVGGWQVHSLTGHSGDVLSVDFSPDGNRVVSGSCDNRVKIWDTATGAEVNSFVGVR